MIISFDEVKQYIRFDYDEDDEEMAEEINLIKTCMAAAERYLVNATGKEYPVADENGNEYDYSLEKIYLGLRIADMYENRNPTCSDKQSYAAKAILLQLQLS